jgi:hypothetical protein
MRKAGFLFVLLLPWLAACGSVPASGTDAWRDDLATEADVLDSRAEAAAAERERTLLAEMAREGVYPVGQPAQATVKYHREDVTFGLYNEAYTSQSDFYSQQRPSANYKVVENLDMGALWKSLEDAGFFAAAQTGVVRVPGASVSVVVRRGASEAWTLAWAPTMDKAAYERTMHCANAVSALFNATMGLQTIENPDGSDYFERERDRLRQQNSDHVAGGPGGSR